MTTAATGPAGKTGRADASFVRARLGSFLAVVPLAIWTVDHLWNNLSAFQGADAWQRDVTDHKSPLGFFVTSIIALLPLALHTVWGVGRLFTSRPNNVKYKYFANLKYTLQRLSAIGLLGFLGAHLWKAMIDPRMKGHGEAFEHIAAYMHHHTPTLVVYVLGVLGIAYHLANGLQTFTMGWGVVTTRRALRRLDVATLLFFFLLLAMGLAGVYGLYEAGASLPPPHG
jgi:succinate dehydrogenase / fumarate reductase cytochrome b subunit